MDYTNSQNGSQTPGQEIGPYRIEGLIGQGGMAEVYRAWNTGLHRYEALKLLPAQMTFDHSFVERFLQEARTAAALRHPNIATIHTVSSPSDAKPFFTMELIEGSDLADLLAARGALPVDEAIGMLTQIAFALDYAHGRGVIHRDVKPANILMQDEGGRTEVKVVDFGIARAQESDGKRLTKTGMIVGTPEYMSPEQAGSGAEVGPATDQYSLAIIAYEMLCGRPPFLAEAGSSPISVIMAHLQQQPVSPAARMPGLPDHISSAILKSLEKNPRDRFASCRQFAEALAGTIDVAAPPRRSTPVPDRNTPRPRTPVPARKASPLPILVAALVIAGLGMLGYGLTRGNRSDTEAPPKGSATHLSSGGGSSAPVVEEKVTVPSFLDLDEAAARKLAQQNRLTLDFSHTHSTMTAGHVVEQDRAPESQIAPNGLVTLKLSSGPETVANTQPDTQTYGRPVDAPDTTSNSSSGGDGWTTYRNDRLGFSMDYPPGWTARETKTSDGTRVTFAPPSGAGDMFVDISAPTNATALGDFQDMDRRFRTANKSRYTDPSVTSATLSGREAARWSFVLTRGGGPAMRKIDWGVHTSRHSYALLFEAPQSQFSQWSPTFDRAVTTIRIFD